MVPMFKLQYGSNFFMEAPHIAQITKLSLRGCGEVVSACFASEIFSRLPNLIHVDLTGCYKITDHTIHQLITDHCRGALKLKTLILHRCFALTSKTLNTIVHHCFKLECLDIGGGCGALVDRRALDVLSHQGTASQRLLSGFKVFKMDGSHYLTTHAIIGFFRCWGSFDSGLNLQSLDISDTYCVTDEVLDCIFPVNHNSQSIGMPKQLRIKMTSCDQVLKRSAMQLKQRLEVMHERKVFVKENCRLYDGSDDDIRRFINTVTGTEPLIFFVSSEV